MAQGSIQLRHKKRCGGRGKNPRTCRCAPAVYAVIHRRWEPIGYLDVGWKKHDLSRFESRLGELREAIETGQPIKRRTVRLLEDYATEWFAELADSARAENVSRLTYNTYEGSWTNHLKPAFGRMPLGAIDEAAIRRYVAAKQAQGLAPTTIDNSLTPLSAMLSDAVSDGLLTRNPLRQPRRARHGGSRRKSLYVNAKRKAPKHLEVDEARALLAVTPAAYRTMVLAALTTGFRRGELLGLRWHDLDFGRSRIELRRQLQNRREVRCKYDSERDVVLYSGLARALGGRRRTEGYVFTDPDRGPWTNEGPARTFLTAAYEAVGLREEGRMWHVLRHTYASILAHAGIRWDVIETLMGHRRQGTTALYTHLLRDAFDGVEEALDQAFGVNQASTAGCVTRGRSDTLPASGEVRSSRGGGALVTAGGTASVAE